MQRTGILAAACLAYRRDLVLAFRHWGQVTQPLVFFAIVATLFPLALGPELAELREIAGGTLWVAALLASLLGVELLFRADHADGTLEQMLLSGQPLAVLVLAKGFAHWTVCGLPLRSMTTRARLSSMGTVAIPYRSIPFLSPRACFNAWPMVMPRSSMRWW